MFLPYAALSLCLCLLLASCTPFTAPQTSNHQSSSLDGDYWLGEASPNPMEIGGTCSFEYGAKDDSETYLIITNVLEQEVVRFYNLQSGNTHWDGKDRHGRVCGSGIYFYKLIMEDGEILRKLLIIE